MNWITILTFQNVHEAYVPKAKLESEEILCFVKNENKMQAENPMGRVELQVPLNEVERAKEILREGDFLKGESKELDPFWLFIKSKTDTIPFIQKLPLEIRFVTIVIAVVICILIPVVIVQSGILES